MDIERPAMPFDDAARALEAQTASRAERSFRAITRNRAGHAERHSTFLGGRGDSNRVQVARQLPEQSEQIFKKGAAPPRIEVHKRQSAGQCELYPWLALRNA